MDREMVSLPPESLPGYQEGNDLDVVPRAREDELEDIIRSKDNFIEKIIEKLDHQVKHGSGVISGEERLTLISLLDKITCKNKELDGIANELSIQIEELTKGNGRLQQDIIDVNELARYTLRELSRRITAIEDKKIKKSKSASVHLDKLFEDMEILGRKQVSFLEASKILNIGKSRMKQLKPNIALDGRFIIVKSRSHKQKELIRLRKYHKLIG
ncbi:Uncharacterised protein [uncultured archaeon]|nr:Uncharacterised protein [uncultured archaeon]